jgi:hypothetical protein|tara:strand:+ start:3903 stop:5357 length:1455 start_codon:yes stop_codon:yes gene_type:complete
MLHFYDGQIRRYITQIIRLLSNFSYVDGKGKFVKVPVMYGDITRQVGHIIRDNSENKIPSAPRIGVYVAGMEMDRTRTADPSYTGKVHIRERAFDTAGNEYLNEQGKNYTVERMMPTPYNLTVTADIWTTNTEQKLQILEQILMLFNPSLEIQTTDNYVDWTSLSVVNLENINFSSRSIPVGTESDIDVATLGFSTPIYISPPAKVKKLGVITNVVMSIFDESKGTINLQDSMPELQAYDDTNANLAKGSDTSTAGKSGSGKSSKSTASLTVSTASGYDAIVMGNVVQLGKNGIAGEINWREVLESEPGMYRASLSKIYLERAGFTTSVVGTFALNTLDETQLIVNWDEDTIPTNTVLVGPLATKGTIDYIIDPTKTNPTNIRGNGIRILLLGDIGSTENTDGADAWKGSKGDFIAKENDIVEWDGNDWNIVFDASGNSGQDSTVPEVTYTTNLNTGIQYKWDGTEWTLTFEGEYRKGTWRLAL